MGETDDRIFLIHYHEIGLKGRNRARFEAQLCRNIERALKNVPHGRLRRISGRLLLRIRPDSPTGTIADRLRCVCGIANFSEATQTASAMDAIRETAWAVVQKARFDSFKVATKRSDKTFPMTSEEINRDVGAYLQHRSQAQVKMLNPDLTCFIELSMQGTFIYTAKCPGPGGLPVGVSERAVSLLSSGIDSPVASYRMMKRGVHLVFVHFHSQPYTDRNSQRNTELLVRILTRYQFCSDLYLIAFVEIQRHIMTHAPPEYRVILYRRAMLLIAESIATSEGASALVTGENVGQVASQTLSNIRAIEDASSLPVLRPLSGHNKEEIITEARQIGTYETSIEPYEDCCAVFVPKHPETKADLETVQKIESRLALEPLIAKALENAETKQFTG